MQVSKLFARFFVVALLAVQIFRPMPVLAQNPTCTDETNCNIGGQNITPEDIAAAINSPTPNLANTTAYVFYTITVLLTGTFDSGLLNEGSEIPSPASGTVPPAVEGDAPQPGQPVRTRSYYPSSVNEAISQDGLIGGVGYLLAGMIKNPPASAGTYVADLVQDSRFTADTAYAQAPGLGFGALNPILGTWKAFRNVSYYLLVLIGLVVGFLVLIRHQAPGNVAVTVQNALPRIVITVILITFSYAIAGLLVDLLFLSIYFIINIFDGDIFESNARFMGGVFTGLGAGRSLSDIAFNTHIFEVTIEYVFGGNAWNAAQSVGDLVFTALKSVGGVVEILADAPIIGNIFEGAVNLIFTLIFAIALFMAMFRTFFALIMSYAGFVINVVMAPFILLPGAIPGRDPFANWLKNLIAGLAPFAVAIFMIFMSFALVGENTVGDIGYRNMEDEENAVGLRLPLIMSGASTSAFTGILAMGFMLLLPEAVNMTKKAVGASGGIFDEFKDKAVANLQQGWSGGELVKGTGVRVPGAGRITMGSNESRNQENQKRQAERTTLSRIRNYGLIPGIASAGRVEVEKQAARYRQVHIEHLERSSPPTPEDAMPPRGRITPPAPSASGAAAPPADPKTSRRKRRSL